MSILINESYANPTTPLWASSTGGGGTNSPMITYNLDPGAVVTVTSGNTLQLAVFSIPDAYAPEDNFLFNFTLGISNITYDETFNPNNVSVGVEFSSDNPAGTVQYANYTTILLTPEITSSLTSINGLLANTGTDYTLMTITIYNGLSTSFSFDYSFTNCFFQKVSSGGIVIP
jgi:hypothetical protein